MKKHNWRLMLRRVLNLVFSRLVVTAVLLVLQVVWRRCFTGWRTMPGGSTPPA